MNFLSSLLKPKLETESQNKIKLDFVGQMTSNYKAEEDKLQKKVNQLFVGSA